MTGTDIALWLLAWGLIAVGVAGTVLPALPGATLIFIGAALGAWIDGFTRVSGVTVGVLAALAILAFVLDYVAGLMGAKKAGASKEALIGAALGTVVGLFMGFVGVFFMPFVGAVIGEYMARREHAGALRVGAATWVGLMLAMVAKVVIAFVMIGIFIVALVF
jgi:uncharacterized protein YqgC (DUF456 family)